MSSATYLEHHTALVDELRKVGIWFDYKQRIELAWLRHNITKVVDKDQSHIIDLIDHCVYDRRRGIEPAHEEGWYV